MLKSALLVILLGTSSLTEAALGDLNCVTLLRLSSMHIQRLQDYLRNPERVDLELLNRTRAQLMNNVAKLTHQMETENLRFETRVRAASALSELARQDDVIRHQVLQNAFRYIDDGIPHTNPREMAFVMVLLLVANTPNKDVSLDKRVFADISLGLTIPSVRALVVGAVVDPRDGEPLTRFGQEVRIGLVMGVLKNIPGLYFAAEQEAAKFADHPADEPRRLFYDGFTELVKFQITGSPLPRNRRKLIENPVYVLHQIQTSFGAYPISLPDAGTSLSLGRDFEFGIRLSPTGETVEAHFICAMDPSLQPESFHGLTFSIVDSSGTVLATHVVGGPLTLRNLPPETLTQGSLAVRFEGRK